MAPILKVENLNRHPATRQETTFSACLLKPHLCNHPPLPAPAACTGKEPGCSSPAAKLRTGATGVTPMRGRTFEGLGPSYATNETHAHTHTHRWEQHARSGTITSPRCSANPPPQGAWQTDGLRVVVGCVEPLAGRCVCGTVARRWHT